MVNYGASRRSAIDAYLLRLLKFDDVSEPLLRCAAAPLEFKKNAALSPWAQSYRRSFQCSLKRTQFAYRFSAPSFLSFCNGTRSVPESNPNF
jgi:hypothetical protein